MRKRISALLTAGGLVALAYSGINYINSSESFSFLGDNFVVSQGDPTPVILSGVVLAIGLIMGQK